MAEECGAQLKMRNCRKIPSSSAASSSYTRHQQPRNGTISSRLVNINAVTRIERVPIQEKHTVTTDEGWPPKRA
jgi:hypothetical protein